MTNETKQMVRNWLQMHGGDTEELAHWMSRDLHLGGIKKCRAIIQEAVG